MTKTLIMSFNTLPKMELTLAILKPHITAVPFRLQEIQNRILSNGFYIIRTKKEWLNAYQVNKFYEDHKGKFFFNRLVTFMCSGPCIFHILARENAIEMWRSMMGPTKVFKTVFSHPDSIRAMHGLSDTRNATHGSDSLASFEKESKVFFPDFNTAEWYKVEHSKFAKGMSTFDKKKFIHIIKTNDES